MQHEINRLRDRMHKAEGTLHALHELQRLDSREQQLLEKRVSALEMSVKQLVDEDRVAAAVAERLKGSAADGFTRLQRWGIRAAIFGAILSPSIVLLQAAGVFHK